VGSLDPYEPPRRVLRAPALSLPTMLALALLLPLLAPATPLAPASAAAPGGQEATTERTWAVLSLPAGFSLDLEAGLVSSRVGEERATVEYQAGRLVSRSPLRVLPAAPGGPAGRVERASGSPVPDVEARAGLELVFDGFGPAWGYLRVLEVAPEAVLLEYVLEPRGGTGELVRRPAALRARSGPEGVDLAWEAEPGALYRVERRRLPAGSGQPPGAWSDLGTVGEGRFRDDAVELASISEYRVARAGEGGGFGAAALGAPGLEPAEASAEFEPGSELNLLSLGVDGRRHDLTVQYVRASGAQVQLADGVLARNLTPAEERAWTLEPLDSEAAWNRHVFLQPGRALALRLPEGVHALLRVEALGERAVVLSRQLDLAGERLFPPPPAPPEAGWEPGRGVVFRFTGKVEAPDGLEVVRVVERERNLDAGDWVRCAVGAPGARELVDTDLGEDLLVRYRFRQGPDLARLSPPGESVTVLQGGEGEASRALLLERAVRDLGAADFDRRRRARAVLVALGEGAWPLLREALRSEDVERASAARELLLRGLREAGEADAALRGGLARLLLGIRAEELGHEVPPHPDWISPEPGVRALAALRGLGWRERGDGGVAAWRRVLEEADPDESVARAAGLAALLQAEGLGPDLVPPRDGAAVEASPGDGAAPAVEAEDPWVELAALQAAREVEARRRGPGRDAIGAGESELLVNLLVERYRRDGDELFLDAALRSIAEPSAALRGALDLLARRSAAAGRAPEGEGTRLVELERPDGEALVAELEALSAAPVRRAVVRLAPGVYVAPQGQSQVSLHGVELVLLGEGEVELRFGLSLLEGSRAVLRGVTLAPDSGMAVNVVRSSAHLADAVLVGEPVALLGADAVVSLERCVVTAPRAAGSAATAVRLSGRSLLLAGESRLEAPGVAVHGVRALLLDRCVVESAERHAVEGSQAADLWAVASLVRARSAPFLRFEHGVLEAVVFDDGVDDPLAGAPGLRACAEHLRPGPSPGAAGEERWTSRCALER
jgi:hypothetical protein